MPRAILSVCALALLAACGDPLAGVPRLAEVELADSEPAAQALPSEEEIAREGYFGTDAAVAEALGDTVETLPKTAPRRTGLLGLLRRDPPKPVAAQEAEVEATVETTIAAPEPAPEPRRGGLFAGLRRSSGGQARSDLPEVDYGTQLPFGEMARSCAAKRQPLGRKVDGETGGYKLYDSNPGTSGLRTFYITGFADGCPRQLTAAHVLLGTPSLYELLHYGPAGKHLKVGATDAAYEKVKGEVCGARKGRPCGARMNRLERSTVFVNAYPRPEDNTAWSEMLIHDGAVLATAQKSSG